MIVLIVILLMSSSRMVSIALVLWEVGAILGNGYGIERQNYVVLHQGGAMSTGFHTRI